MLARHLYVLFLIQIALSWSAHAAEASGISEATDSGLSKGTGLEREASSARNWSVQASVAWITTSKIEEVLVGGINLAEGEAGGQLYSFTFSWTARRFEIPLRGRILTPRFEPYARLTLVDEKGGSFFPDYNAGVGFRWVDFPWNRWVKTGLFIGIGLSYSSKVYTVDREEHLGEERSHLKLDWPIELTFALPRWPRHQIVVFNDHQSGGHIFDEGGLNSVGIGYRYEF